MSVSTASFSKSLRRASAAATFTCIELARPLNVRQRERELFCYFYPCFAKIKFSAGICFGHEITGEVVEKGRDVEFVHVGDLVSVPFNIACGRCVNCNEGKTGICLNVNPARPGAAYGYVDMGGWVGGQADFAMVPYADFNCLVIPGPRDRAMDRILSIACLADIFPTGYHGAISAGVTTGSTVYVAGAGPVGLACAASCQLLGAAVVIVGDMNAARLKQAESFGCKTIGKKKVLYCDCNYFTYFC